MRLVKFLNEIFDYRYSKFTLERNDFFEDRNVWFISYKFVEPDTKIEFVTEYVFSVDSGILEFGFRRTSLKYIEIWYEQNPDFGKYPGKVYSGLMQGLEIVTKRFRKELKELRGIAFIRPPRKDPKNPNKKCKTLIDIYDSKGFKQAVQKVTGLKFSSDKIEGDKKYYFYT